jgi:hypothetical protein
MFTRRNLMALSITNARADDAEVPDGGSTDTPDVTLLGTTDTENQPVYMWEGNNRLDLVTAVGYSITYKAYLKEPRAYVFRLTTRDGQNASNNWTVNKS